MSGINKVILVGRVGKEPICNYTQSGLCITTISLATSESFKDKSGQKQEKTEWHNIVFFEKLAEICQKYVEKGSLLYIEGRLKTEKYTDKSGIEKYATKIIANNMQMLSSSKQRDDSDQEKESYNKYTKEMPYDQEMYKEKFVASEVSKIPF